MIFKKTLYLLVCIFFGLSAFMASAVKEKSFDKNSFALVKNSSQAVKRQKGFLFGSVVPVFRALKDMEFATVAGNIGYGKNLDSRNAVLAGLYLGDIQYGVNLGYEHYFFDKGLLVPGVEVNTFIGAGQRSQPPTILTQEERKRILNGDSEIEEGPPIALALGASVGGFVRMGIAKRVDVFLKTGVHTGMVPVNDWKFLKEDLLFYFGLHAKWYFR